MTEPATAAGRGSLERALIDSGHDPDEVRAFVAEAHARADEATTTAARVSWRWRLACTLTFLAGTFAATGRRVSVLALIIWWLGGLALAWWTGVGFAEQTEDDDA